MSSALVVSRDGRMRASRRCSTISRRTRAGCASCAPSASRRSPSWRSPACGSCSTHCSTRLGGLTPPRRHALSSALGLAEGERARPLPDRRGGARPLAIAAEQEPLLAIVDDAHWLDGASQDALLFVARRLAGEGIALIFGADDDDRSFAAAGVPRLELAGLDDAGRSR